MNEIQITLDQLRGMIGVRVWFQNRPWEVIEVLEDGPTLVLGTLEASRVLQADQYNEGYRRVPERVTVPVLSADRRALHPEFLALDLV